MDPLIMDDFKAIFIGITHFKVDCLKVAKNKIFDKNQKLWACWLVSYETQNSNLITFNKHIGPIGPKKS